MNPRPPTTLDFVEGSTVNIDGANIVFDFDNPGTFFRDDGAGFPAEFGGSLPGDPFTREEGGAPAEWLTLNADSGDLSSASATPEPGTMFLPIPVLGILGFFARKRATGKP